MKLVSTRDRLQSIRAVVVGVLTALSCMGPIARADNPANDVFRAMTEAAITGTVRGDDVARGTLEMLLDVPAPWNSTVLDTLERSDAIVALNRPLRPGSRTERESVDALLARIAVLQGASTRSTAAPAHADGRELLIDFTPGSPRWLHVDSDGPHELFIGSSGCTPTVAAFAASARLPATPVPGLARYSADLASVPLNGAAALRVERGDCEGDDVRLALTLEPSRQSTARAADDGGMVIGANRSPLPVNRVVVVPIGRTQSEKLALMTEPGFVYEVFAAPMTPGVDPAVIRGDPAEPKAGDDNSGWDLGARLKEFVGTGSEEHLTVLRVSDTHGDVAVLVRQQIAIAVRPNRSSDVKIVSDTSTWRRAELTAGRWDLRLQSESESLDAAMIVHDAATGSVIGANDDESDDVLSPRVHLLLDKPTVVLIRLISVEGDGTANLTIRPEGKASTESVPRTRGVPRKVST